MSVVCEQRTRNSGKVKKKRKKKRNENSSRPKGKKKMIKHSSRPASRIPSRLSTHHISKKTKTHGNITHVSNAIPTPWNTRTD